MVSRTLDFDTLYGKSDSDMMKAEVEVKDGDYSRRRFKLRYEI